jgi:hypothetical protein
MYAAGPWLLSGGGPMVQTPSGSGARVVFGGPSDYGQLVNFHRKLPHSSDERCRPREPSRLDHPPARKPRRPIR